MSSDETPAVLIVGGGPVGLSLAIELRSWGVLPLVVERRAPEELVHPTANHLSVRTLELLRRWGLADEAREAGFPTDWAGAVGILTHIGGFELAHVRRQCAADPRRRSYSPEAEVWQPKRFFDPVLRRAAEERGAMISSRTEVSALREDEDGVTADVVDLSSGRRRQVRAAFAVACDGAGSRVRDWIGEELWGLPSEAPIESVYFRSRQLMNLVPRDRWQYRLLGRADGPDPFGWMLITIDGKELWRLHGPGIMEPEDPDATAANLKRLAGSDIDVEVLTMAAWQSRQALCPSFRKGRIFLAGDAAARGSTYGGMWMNRGIADAVDIGWKLAGVLQGWGGDGLLESYTHERRQATLDLLLFQGSDLSGAEPVIVTEREFGHAGAVPNPPSEFWNDDEEGARRRQAVHEQFASLPEESTEWPRADLGYRYDGSPVIVGPGSPATSTGTQDWSRYVQTAEPGGRAPHARLADGSSSLDWFRQAFTVVDIGGDSRALVDAAQQRGVPLVVARSDEPEVKKAYQRPLTLVRPDGFVAWQGEAPSADEADRIIDTVRGARAAAEGRVCVGAKPSMIEARGEEVEPCSSS